MAETAPPGLPKPAAAKSGRDKAILWTVFALFFTINVGIFLRACHEVPSQALEKAGQLMAKGGQALADVASAFRQGRITTEFFSYASSIHPTHRLQFATLKQKEIFTRKDEASTAFGYVPLPEIIVEARAPVEFTYYLDLNARWQIVLQDGLVQVLAPAIRFNTPAVDASGIQYEIRKDSALRNSAAALEGLKQSITMLAKDRARENINLVRETARRQTSEFVENWLMKSFSDGKKYPVKVFFADEKLPPDLRWDEAAPLR